MSNLFHLGIRRQADYRLEGKPIEQHSPAVCLYVEGEHDYMTIHFESPGEMAAFGERIVGEAMRLMREAQAGILSPADAAEIAAALDLDTWTETRQTHTELPDHIKPKRKPCWDQFDAGEVPVHQGTALYLEYARWKLAGGKVQIDPEKDFAAPEKTDAFGMNQ